MKTRPSIKKNVIFNTIYQVLTLLTPFITTPYISRTIGPDGIGIYSFTNSLVMYFTMFAALGTVAYGTREISRNRDEKSKVSQLFWEIEILTVVTTCICLLLWMLFIQFNKEYKIYYIILSLSLIATLFDISWLYAGLEEFRYTITQNAIFKILGIVALFVFVKSKEDTPLYVLIMSLTLLLGNISMWIYLPRFVERVPLRSIRLINHFRETLIYFIPTIAISIYTILDKTLIGLITHSEYENGYYEQATKIVNMIKSFTFYSINTVMGARISLLFAEKRFKEIRERIIKSMDIILLIGYGAVCGVCAVAKIFVPIFFGEGYDYVVILLYWMSPLIIIISISNCLGAQYYSPAGLRSKSAKYIVIGSLINLIFNLLFIPKFGSVGAVIGSIFAEGTISYLYLVNCDNYLKMHDVFALSYKRIIAGLLMLFVLHSVRNAIYIEAFLDLLIQVVLGLLVYVSVLIVLHDDMLLSLMKKISIKLKGVAG